MSPAKPLLALLEDLRLDGAERDACASDPEGYLAAHGWDDLDPSELREALGIVRDTVPFSVAVTLPEPGDDLGRYVDALAAGDGDHALDLEDFGADATLSVPADAELPAAGHDVDEPAPAHADAHDADDLDVDLGPAGAEDDDDDEDGPDDLIDL